MRSVGTSPRKRGNRRRVQDQHVRVRDIPAQAGEPPATSTAASRGSGHPRASGGTTQSDGTAAYLAGTSPRKRGNHYHRWSNSLDYGDIPAQAGEPELIMPKFTFDRGHPRASGGTRRRPSKLVRVTGTSPRKRGNRAHAPGGPLGGGDIPAQAGEPREAAKPPSYLQGHPRASGGTIVKATAEATASGTSPRKRGNRQEALRELLHQGDIPAQAGEPFSMTAINYQGKGHPRASGGTFVVALLSAQVMGTSPRKRGNLHQPLCWQV